MKEEQLENIKNIIENTAEMIDSGDRRSCKEIVKIILESIVMYYTQIIKESKESPLESANTEEEREFISILTDLKNKL